jgi:hypothetical protein
MKKTKDIPARFAACAAAICCLLPACRPGVSGACVGDSVCMQLEDADPEFDYDQLCKESSLAGEGATWTDDGKCPTEGVIAKCERGDAGLFYYHEYGLWYERLQSAKSSCETADGNGNKGTWTEL